jgi:hypothetical protein
MALVTNRCKKHGNAYPENECPYCKHESFTASMEASRTFFTQYGAHDVKLVIGSRSTGVTVEEMFAHFRIRILEELNPVLQRIAKDAHDLGIAAFNSHG